MDPALRKRSRNARSAAFLCGLALLGVLAWWAGERLRLSTWWTSDEPAHTRAARELRDGLGVVSNFEHPVLMKVVAAAGIGPRAAASTIAEVRDARRFFPSVFAALVLVTGIWVASRAGPAFGIALSALVLVEPSIRAYACLVHTDVLLTFFLVSAAAALDLATRGRTPSTGGLVASGILYGGALVSKYSALPFLAVFAAVAWATVEGRSRGSSPAGRAVRAASLRSGARTLAIVVLPALLLCVLVQQAVVGTTPRASLDAAIRRSVENRAFESMTAGAWRFVAATERLPGGIAAYAAGLEWVERGGRPGSRLNYLFGRISGTGFIWYFPVALAAKLTTASLALLALAAALAASGIARAVRAGPGLFHRLVRARPFVPAALGLSYLLLAMTTHVNIGVRHVMPAAVLLLVAAILALRSARRVRRRAAAALLAGGVLLAAAEAWGSHGRELSYGSLLAGGPRGVRTWLSESNVDWGAGQGRLFDRVRRGDLGRVAAFTFWLDAEEARGLGINWLTGPVTGEEICSYDSVFVSVYVWDSLAALLRNTERYPVYEYYRRTYRPAIRVRVCAAVVEEVGPEYLLFRRSPPATAR